MEAETPHPHPHHHGHHQHQSEEEAAASHAAAAADVVDVSAPVLPMEEEVIVAAMADDDAAARLDLDLDAIAAVAEDEAFAQALYMEELMQAEENNWGGVGRFDFEEPSPPRRIVFHHFGAHEREEIRPRAEAEQAVVHHQFPAAGGSPPPPVVFNDTADHGHHHQQPLVGNGRGGEAVTIRLEPRSSPDAFSSARQAVLGHASSAPAVLAGMEEVEDHDNSWYESILRDAQRIEQMEEPGAYDYEPSFQFQTQLPAASSPERTEEPFYNSSTCKGLWDFDRDEPGPSTARRVPPLADDELPKFSCGICMETLPILDIFHGMQCDHRFCVECMATYIEGRINAGEVPIPCPDPACREKQRENNNDDDDNSFLHLHPEECKKSIDFAAFGNWGIRLTESAIPANQRAYCPNEQCGVMLEATGGNTPVMAFCPVCGHPMCATCGLDWSSDDSANHDCTEGPSGALVKKLAEKRRWKQCPRCLMLVEKTIGCNVLRCRNG
ncbi:hypothetical protein HU200_037600 [Digitaria exilis]|uniref:RBR-type E3 ubiquitin transferase n=1 Tax=Digitaria exilis TaxID=1010633 RepID=A0A835EH72_9POAL|nr:hypothetical protein HU200_037600 [Digitaria exilis]